MYLSRLQHALVARQHAGLFRQSHTITQYQGRHITVNDRRYLNFSANDYLGLAQDPMIQMALAEGAQRFGVGSTGSPLVTGYHDAHQRLSEQIADWLGFERVLLFSSGFAANLTMLQTLAADNDFLLLDKLSHASLIDAARQHKGRFKRFTHNDLAALARLLPELPTDDCHSLVVTEGVFSMDGDSPDLLGMSALCQARQAALLLDDAHGLGVLGEQGRGSWFAQGLAAPDIYCYMANFGKALGVGGAFLAASKTVIEYIEQFGRHYIYSTALSPALCAAVSKSIELVKRDQWRRDKLADNIGHFSRLATAAGIPCLTSTSAIQAVMLGDSDRAMAVSQRLRDEGIWLTAIRPPTVPPDSARLRVTLSASHEPQDIKNLINTLEQILLC
ncbi:aminotransferase class I/II-fold pyridoxal phosphate-dependent enzyme [Alishewanella tabrizica]|uniref:8-amino-7-oxononanoate synthase n=1 Tax=Alishewanella tabrizica TaxID=671278 RepID=A0ABQ2WMF7_9ALTE|nr:8-amino-7-oxononanoate synthase [Alishewanella tabrizica]GGW58051.1 8-amino-7-oxononanoate synthase [Alishewanella tabrizica]